MAELEKEYNKVIKKKPTPENLGEFKALRLRYAKTRTGTAEIHKKMKQFYLLGGRFVDGFKNAQIFASQNKEEKLKEKEEYFIIKEREEQQAKQEQRTQELITLGMQTLPTGLGMMDDETYNLIKNGYVIQKAEQEKKKKLQEEQEKKAQEKENRDRKRNAELAKAGILDYARENYPEYAEVAEEEFKSIVAKGKEHREEQDRKERTKNKREEELKLLWNFVPKGFDIHIEESTYQDQLKQFKKAKEEYEEKAEKLKKENEKAEKARKENEKKLKAEKERADALAKKEADRIAQEAAEAERQLTMDDKERFNQLLSDLETIKTKHTGKFKSESNKKKYEQVKVLIDKILNHIK